MTAPTLRGSLSAMPEDTFHHRTTAAAAPERIWQELQRAATWQGFGMMETVSGEVVENGHLRSFTWSAIAAGTRHEGSARVIAAEAGRRITLALEAREVGGEITVDLAPEGLGTDLAVTLTARSQGMIAGLFWGVIRDALQRAFPTQVEDFAAAF